MDSTTADHQGGYVWDCDLHKVVSLDGNPVSQSLGDDLGLEDSDPMDIDGPAYREEVRRMNLDRELEDELIYLQNCSPEELNGPMDGDPPSNIGNPKVPDPSEGGASLVPRSVTLPSDGACPDHDQVLNEIIEMGKRGNDHGLRKGARVGRGPRRTGHSKADSKGDRPTLPKVKHPGGISKRGTRDDSKRRGWGLGQ